MNIEDIKKKLDNFEADWIASRGCCDTEDFREEVRFLLQELDKAQRGNERLTRELNNYKSAVEHIVKSTPNADECFFIASEAFKFDGACKHYWQYNDNLKEVCSECGVLKEDSML